MDLPGDRERSQSCANHAASGLSSWSGGDDASCDCGYGCGWHCGHDADGPDHDEIASASGTVTHGENDDSGRPIATESATGGAGGARIETESKISSAIVDCFFGISCEW